MREALWVIRASFYNPLFAVKWVIENTPIAHT
jgi:hypothetical protein